MRRSSLLFAFSFTCELMQAGMWALAPCAYRRLCAVGFLRIIALLTTYAEPSVPPPDYAVLDGKPRSWAGILRIVPHGAFYYGCCFIWLSGMKNVYLHGIKLILLKYDIRNDIILFA
jgi:hypothetical protein